MGVYLVNDQFNNVTSIFEPIMIYNSFVKTWDGYLYYILENPLEFVESNYDLLNDDNFAELKHTIHQSNWLKGKELLISRLSEIRALEKWRLFKDLGDKYFAEHEFDKSLDYYIKFIEAYESLEYEVDEKSGFLDYVYCQLGIILITIGEINEGIELMGYAYDLHQSYKILLQLTKYKVEFNIIDDLFLVETIVSDILNHPLEDDKLVFLVWYYHYIGEDESSVTSYMQIKNIALRFKLVDYYMVYMLESNQHIAMESFLKPLKDVNECHYFLELIYVFIRLEYYEEALKIIAEIKFSADMNNLINIQKSICNLGLKRIIESITAINQINEKSLTEQNREYYYIQLAKLSKYSKDFSKEDSYNRQLLSFWQQKYRKIYSRILYNMKWKVNK